jgi:hypothetical protein
LGENDAGTPLSSRGEIADGVLAPGEPTFRSSTFIVVGHVVELLPARFTGSNRPLPSGELSDDFPEDGIITPAVVALDGAPLLNRDQLTLGDEIVVGLQGGVVDGYQFVTNLAPRLTVGERVLLDLAPFTTVDGAGPRLYATEAGVAWKAALAYDLGADGVARGNWSLSDLTQPTDDLLATVAAAATYVSTYDTPLQASPIATAVVCPAATR